MKCLTKKNLVKLLTQIQDEGDFHANALATQAVIDFGLESERIALQKYLHIKHLNSEKN